MLRRFVALALVALSAQTMAQGQPPTLWQNLRVGMSKAEVQRLYPDGKVALTPSCSAKVIGRYERGALNQVILRFGDLMAAGRTAWANGLECQKIVRASILQRYGEPTIATRREISALNRGEKLIWERPNVLVEFYAQDTRPFTVISYSYVPPPERVAPDAASKL